MIIFLTLSYIGWTTRTTTLNYLQINVKMVQHDPDHENPTWTGFIA